MRKRLKLKEDGSERSTRLRRHQLISMVAKGIGMLAGLLIIPLALNLLGDERYGIWLTISTVTGWFTFMDLGMGNGLRNRFAEAKAKGQTILAQRYISTTYFLVAGIAVLMVLLFLIAHPFVPWGELFNAEEKGDTIAALMRLVFLLFFLKFAFDPIAKVILGDQRPGLNVAMRSFARLAVLLFLFLLTLIELDSLVLFGSTVQGINTLLPLLVALILFSGPYKAYRPSLSSVDLSLTRDLMGLGFKFFLMQLAAIVLFATDHMIITRLFGPSEVPPYHIAFRYFTIALVFFKILTNPYWSAFTDAFHRGDLQWIRSATRRQLSLWGLLVIGVLLMLFLADPIYRIWLGEDRVEIPFPLSLSMAVWVVLSSFTTIFGNFLSGLGKVRLSVFHSLVFMLLNIPLSIFLAGYLGMGPKGVILGTILSVLPQGILHPIQYRKIMKGTAKGIWNK